MTIDTARLRALAEAATLNDDPDDWPFPEAVGWDRDEDNQFVAAVSPKLVLALLDRLEAADQRAELAEANLSVEESKNAGYRAKNNQLAAVVEKVREADTVTSSWDHFGHLVMDILATAPAGILREHDATLIEGLADEWHADNTGTSPRAYNWLREKARQRREERA